MKILYIILIIVIPLIYYGFPKLDYLKLNRHYFKDRNIEDNINPFIEEALKKYDMKGFKPYHYTNLYMKDENGKTKIEVELFIINKNENCWNPVQKLLCIKGYKTGDNYIIEDLVENNSVDIGKIIPNNSNVPQNTLFRNRRWENHKKNWDLYKKDWSVKYSDKPIF
jgi:hypothetical protein